MKKNENSCKFLFDIYNKNEVIYLWVLDENKKIYLFHDIFYPTIYVQGNKSSIYALVKKLYKLNSIQEEPTWVKRKHFYSNEQQDVLAIKISKPATLNIIKNKLYAFYDKLDIYHTDIPIILSYLHEKKIFPLAELQIESKIYEQKNLITKIYSTTSRLDYNYKLPHLRILDISLKKSFRLPISKENCVVLKFLGKKINLACDDPQEVLQRLNFTLEQFNPDVIISHYGDHIIIPQLLNWSKLYETPILFDRSFSPQTQSYKSKGTSFHSYGSSIFRAPSYPFFGRWHIDAKNSFSYKETNLFGVIEMARLSVMPIQLFARSSTGTALTYMETFEAFEKGYLIPWQKSKLEEKKTWYQLLQGDKGGLVFVPNISQGNVFENIIQLDFSQMYPMIMHHHNISPETINCECCKSVMNLQKVPELNYSICSKRRGVVSDTLQNILKRRQFFKDQNSKLVGLEKRLNQYKIDSLKWVNVVSFGYLGFRNAKFGKLESHEAVTAFGRDKLTKAMRLSEKKGFRVLHAITDSLFLQFPAGGATHDNLEKLSNLKLLILNICKVKIDEEGIYSWLVFLPSKKNSNLPVANRYMGRFSNSDLKIRGIDARRKDIPTFIKSAQKELLAEMQTSSTIYEVKQNHGKMHLIFNKNMLLLLSAEVAWQDLLIKKTVGKSLENYRVKNSTSAVIRQLYEENIFVQPGEKIKYLVQDINNKSLENRYLAEELALRVDATNIKYDYNYYIQLLLKSYKELWQLFSPKDYFLDLERSVANLNSPSLFD